MNVDEILQALNGEQVDYLLIGGMNFLIRHLPDLTFDVDIWIRDDSENLPNLNRALRRMGAQWGRTEAQWAPVPGDWHWLQLQGVFCLTTEHGALDVFREVRGLEGRYLECKGRSVLARTATGMAFAGLADEDMLACQLALPPGEQKTRRMEVLRAAIRNRKEQ
jgi:hypothetical protein